MIHHHYALIGVAEHMAIVLVTLRVAIGNDAETLPEQTVMGGNHHLDPAQVRIGKKEIDDV